MKTTLFNRLTAGLLAAVLCLSVLAGCAAKPQKELTRYSTIFYLSLIHISEPTRLLSIS